MSKEVSFFSYENLTLPMYVEDFHFTLPFPLSLPYYFRVLLSAYLFLVLIFGLKFRKIIFRYLQNPETNSNPINKLIFANMLSGTLLGTVNVTFGIVVNLLPSPFPKILGDNTCQFIKMSGSLNLHGSFIWTCLIAICRILYIKAQNFIKYKVGEQRMVILILTFGMSLQFALSFIPLYFDNASLLWKLCTHHSQEYLDNIQDFQVTKCINCNAENFVCFHVDCFNVSCRYWLGLYFLKNSIFLY